MTEKSLTISVKQNKLLSLVFGQSGAANSFIINMESYSEYKFEQVAQWATIAHLRASIMLETP